MQIKKEKKIKCKFQKGSADVHDDYKRIENSELQHVGTYKCMQK